MATPVVMALEPRWIDGLEVNADQLKSDYLEDYFDGVAGLADLKVTERALGANLTVDVSAGSARISADVGSGTLAYKVRSDGTVNVPFDPVPAAGNSRRDLVYAQVREGADDDWIIGVVTGTPTTGSPSTPATPANAVPLAYVLLTSATSSITDGIITDQRTAMHRVAHVDNRDGVDGYFGGGIFPGQVWVDLESGETLTLEDGDAAAKPTGAGTLRALGIDVDFSPVVGGAPPAGIEDMRLLFQLVTASISFNSDGQARLDLPAPFPNGILGFLTLSTANSTGAIYSRRTDGLPPDASSITLFGITVSPTSGISKIVSTTRTVTALVIGY